MVRLARPIIEQTPLAALPSRRELELPARDGRPLGVTLFAPAARPRSTVVVHGATAVPQSYYQPFAEFLASRGHQVVTYDYRGVGRSASGSLRGLEARMQDWGELDGSAVMRWARAELQGDRPLLIVGHSFGGQMIGLVDELRAAEAALLVGSQLGYYGHWPMPARLGYGLLWHLMVPAVTRAVGYYPGWLGMGGTDLPAGVARQWARWCRDWQYLIGTVPEARARFSRFDRPVRFYSFTDDAYAPLPAVEHLVSVLDRARIDHRRIAPAEVGQQSIGHFGFFRPRLRDALWQGAAEFLEQID